MGCVVCNQTHGMDEEQKQAYLLELANDIVVNHPEVVQEIERIKQERS